MLPLTEPEAEPESCLEVVILGIEASWEEGNVVGRDGGGEGDVIAGGEQGRRQRIASPAR